MLYQQKDTEKLRLADWLIHDWFITWLELVPGSDKTQEAINIQAVRNWDDVRYLGELIHGWCIPLVEAQTTQATNKAFHEATTPELRMKLLEIGIKARQHVELTAKLIFPWLRVGYHAIILPPETKHEGGRVNWVDLVEQLGWQVISNAYMLDDWSGEPQISAFNKGPDNIASVIDRCQKLLQNYTDAGIFVGRG